MKAPAASLPPEPETPAYIDPGVAIGALRDAMAAVRCSARSDHYGLYAIATGTDAPRVVVQALALIAASICQRSGLDVDGIDALTGEICSGITDGLLDQPRTRAAGEVI